MLKIRNPHIARNAENKKEKTNRLLYSSSSPRSSTLRIVTKPGDSGLQSGSEGCSCSRFAEAYGIRTSLSVRLCQCRPPPATVRWIPLSRCAAPRKENHSENVTPYSFYGAVAMLVSCGARLSKHIIYSVSK
jgi:hypothetical protein